MRSKFLLIAVKCIFSSEGQGAELMNRGGERHDVIDRLPHRCSAGGKCPCGSAGASGCLVRRPSRNAIVIAIRISAGLSAGQMVR